MLVSVMTRSIGAGSVAVPSPILRGGRRNSRGRCLVVMLLVLLVLFAGSGLVAGAVAADVDVEAIDANVVLGEAITQRGQVVEQCLSRDGRVGFDFGRHDALLHVELDPHGAELRRAESQAERAAAILRGFNGFGDAADETGSVDRGHIGAVACLSRAAGSE